MLDYALLAGYMLVAAPATTHTVDPTARCYVESADPRHPRLPNSTCTPGVVNPLVTPREVCTPGWTKTQRHTSGKLKAAIYREYGIVGRSPGEYEIDHLISIELGGADVQDNLWPQAYVSVIYNAHDKDKLENNLKRRICAILNNGTPTAFEDATTLMHQFQQEIAANWIVAYETYVGDGEPDAEPEPDTDPN